MARLFDSASSQILDAAMSGIGRAPITMACWYYPTQTTTAQVLMSHSDSAGASRSRISWQPASNQIRAEYVNDANSWGIASVTVTAASAVNNWNFACGIFVSDGFRRIHTGAASGVNYTDVYTHTRNTIAIGGQKTSSTASAYFDGGIAHSAFWNGELSDAEIVRLYNSGIGLDPRSVRPDLLLAYWPLLQGDEDADWWRKYHLTDTGSPTYMKHPPVLMRRSPRFVMPASTASGPPTISSVTLSGTSQIGSTLTATVVTDMDPVDSTTYQWEMADDGSGTNGGNLSGETSSTLDLTYADAASRLDDPAKDVYVRCTCTATKNSLQSDPESSAWQAVTVPSGAGGGTTLIGSPLII